MIQQYKPLLALVVIAFTSGSGCTDRAPPTNDGHTTFAGVVSMGAPVQGALHLHALDNELGVLAELGGGASDDAGAFSFQAVTPSGLGRLCAAGPFADPVTNSLLRVDELCAIVDLAAPPSRIAVSPASYLAATLAACRARQGVPARSAYDDAKRAINALAACQSPGLDVVAAVPVTVTRPPLGAGDAAELHAGIFAAGFSQQAANIAIAMGYTPGRRLTTSQLFAAVITDIRNDCVFDGMDGDTAVLVEGHQLTSQTLRSGVLGFAQAVREFVAGEWNKTGLTLTDIQDYLACVSAAPAGTLFPDAGRAYDGTAPEIVFGEVAAISAPRTICVTVTDASPIAEAAFSPSLGGETFDDVTGQLCGLFDPVEVADGDFDLTATAQDEYGNNAAVTRRLRINTNGPVITIVSPAANATVSGVATFVFEVVDQDGVATVALTSPQNQAAAVVSPGRYSFSLDTKTRGDGPLQLSVEARDAGGRPSVGLADFVIDNVDPGSVSGCAFVDSPLVGAVVTARVLHSDATVGDPVVTAITDAQGCFRVTMPDTVLGLIRLTAEGGTFRAAATDGIIGLGTFRGLSATLMYTPSRNGTTLANVSIHPYTTLADWWTDYRLATTSETPTAAVTLGQQLVSSHLGAGAPFSIANTYPRDFLTTSQHFALTSEASTRLGLAILGLGQCGADIAVANGSAPTALTSVDVLKALAADAGNGLYDGDPGAGGRVKLLATEINSNFLRSSLSRCVTNWLQSSQNESGLVVANFSQPSGFLAGITQNTEARLFGATPPDVFDNTPPALQVSFVAVRSGGNVTVDPRVPLSGDALLVEVTATDTSGFPEAAIRLELEADPGHALGWNIDPAPPAAATTISAHYPLKTTLLTDGAHMLYASAKDAVGNATALSPVPFFVDNTAPNVTINVPALLPSPAAKFAWIIQDSVGPIADLVLTVDGTAEPSIANPGATGETTVILPRCDARISWKAVATDAAGHAGSATGDLACDATAPALTITAPALVSAPSATFAWTLTDTIGPVRSLAFTVGGVAQTPITNPPGAGTALLALPACDTSAYWQAVATDAAGHATTKTGTVVCDGTPPSLAITAPAIVTQQSATFSWVLSDSIGPVTQLAFEIAGVDQPPISMPAGTNSVSLPLPTCDATIAWRATATDAAGNSTSKSGSIACDGTPPSLTVAAPKLVAVKNANFAWTVSDVVGPVQSLQFTVAGVQQPALNLPKAADSITYGFASCDTTIAWQAVATDGAGRSTTRSDTLVCDATAPNLNVTAPTLVGGTRVYFSWTTSDALSSVASLTFKLGSQVQPAIVHPSMVTGISYDLPACNGTTVWEATAVDAAGNSTTRTGAITCDATAPNLNVTAPTLVGSSSASFHWTVSDSIGPVQSLQFTVGGTPQASIAPGAATASGDVTYTFSGCNKVVTWQAVATDAAGNSATTSGSFGCDNTAPAVELQASSYTPEPLENFDITFTAMTLKTDLPKVDIVQGQPRTIIKARNFYWHGVKNMPRLEFRAYDAGPVATPQASLTVQYQYCQHLTDAVPCAVLRDWTVVPASAGADYALELSPTMLHESITDSIAARLHRIRLRAIDLAHNVQQIDFTFRFVFTPVPLVVDGCEIAAELFGTSLENTNGRTPNMQGSYGGRVAPMFHALVRWPVGVVPFHVDQLQATMSGALATTRIWALASYWNSIGDERYYTESRPGNSWGCGTSPPLCGTSLQGNGCTVGACPSQGPGCDRATCPALPSDERAHTMGYRLGAGATTSAPLAITPNVTFDLWADATASNVFVDGSQYMWPVDPTTRLYVHPHTVTLYQATRMVRNAPPGEPVRIVVSGRDVSYKKEIVELHVDVTPLLALPLDPMHPDDTPAVVKLSGNCNVNLRYITTPTGKSVTTY